MIPLLSYAQRAGVFSLAVLFVCAVILGAIDRASRGPRRTDRAGTAVASMIIACVVFVSLLR